MSNTDDEVEAIVVDVIPGKKGKPYVVTYPGKDTESITFELAIWENPHPPKNGQVVLLSGVRRFHEGWRASVARPILYVPKQVQGGVK